jgi:hypothetical protein
MTDNQTFINPFFNAEDGKHYIHFKFLDENSMEFRIGIEKINEKWAPSDLLYNVWHDLNYVSKKACPHCKTNAGHCRTLNQHIGVIFDSLIKLPEIRLHLITC